MKFVQPLVALGAVLLLAGCPDIPGITSAAANETKAVAVTRVDARGITSATVTLTWKSVSNASIYQIGSKVGSAQTETLVDSTDKTTYQDRVNPEMTLTYYVHALSPAGEELAVTPAKTVTVLPALTAKPTGLLVDGLEASSSATPKAKSGKPTLSWSTAQGANAYYVAVNEVKDGGGVGRLAYASLTNNPTATVGTLALPDLNIAGFTQVKGDTLAKGKIYNLTVTAIRTDVADLAAATGFAVSVNDGLANFIL